MDNEINFQPRRMGKSQIIAQMRDAALAQGRTVIVVSAKNPHGSVKIYPFRKPT